jgi:hypothetical protein
MYLVFDIGCIECGEASKPVGLYKTKAEAIAARDEYRPPNIKGWGRPEWRGQHAVEVFPIMLPV